MTVVWHDLECGAYDADLPCWRELAEQQGGPVLDVGAGTGRVALDLARRGFEVTALDVDPSLSAELSRRARDLPVTTVTADARDFELGRRFSLCLAPMQTVQLLGGRDERLRFLTCARRHLCVGGLLALAIAENIECYEVSDHLSGPLPDMVERDGVVYSSQPTAIRATAGGFTLERRRERVGPRGERVVAEDVIQLDALSSAQLEDEGTAAGLRLAGRCEIEPTAEHVGSMVVMLRA